MVSKEYLSRLRKLDNLIDSKCSRIEKLRYEAMRISSPKLYSDRVQVSYGAGNMSDLIDQSVELEKEVQEMSKQYFLLKDKVINLIHTLDDPLFIELLYLRYVGRYDKETGRTKYMTLTEIANTVRRTDGKPYNYVYIRGAHGEALRVLDAKLKDLPD